MFKKIVLPCAILMAVAAPAFAADLPANGAMPMYAPPPVPIFTWTGVYIGGDLGYQWGKSNSTQLSDFGLVEDFPELDHNDSGIVGGGHLGYNWQISQFVGGIEGDVSGSSYKGSSGIFEDAIEHTGIPIQASIRARAGVAWDRVLIFATGGVAFASIRNTLDIAELGDESFSTTRSRVGWTVGGGIEYAIDNNWSVRAQYLYANYGRVSYDLGFIGEPEETLSKRITDNRAEAGFSYKFDFMAPPAPVVAKY